MLYGTIRRTCSALARAVYRPRLEGLHNVPTRGQVILASNHLSFCDSVVIPLAVPRRVRFLAKSDYFDGPGLKGRVSKVTFDALGAMPVKRGTGRNAMIALEDGLRVLNNGEVYAIYPEGTRSRDGRLYRGRTGVAYLALASKAPVVPVALWGTQEIQPIGARMPRVRPIGIRFGAPLDFSAGYDHLAAGKARRVVTDEIMDAVQRLSGQESAGTYNGHADRDAP